VFEKVDWLAYNKALHAVPRYSRVTITKLSHNLWNTNVQNNKYYGTSDLCPCCQMKPETVNHVTQCHSPTATITREQAKTQLLNLLWKAETPQIITQHIQAGLNQWEQGDDHIYPKHSTVALNNPNHMHAFIDQKAIGWDQFLKGRISTLWWQAFTHLTTMTRPQSDKSLAWSKKLIHALWDNNKTIWLHCNSIVHGQTVEEHRQKMTDALHNQQ
jgi:hypothetical protein